MDIKQAAIAAVGPPQPEMLFLTCPKCKTTFIATVEIEPRPATEVATVAQAL